LNKLELHYPDDARMSKTSTTDNDENNSTQVFKRSVSELV